MINKRRLMLLLMTLISVVLVSCTTIENNQEDQTTIMVSAAASLTALLDEVIGHYEQKHTHIDVLVNYGSSGTLQRQIEQGAPVDMYISAGEIQMDRLIERGFVAENQVVTLLTNNLVVIEPISKEDNGHVPDYANLYQVLEQINPKYIAIGEINTVPAGIYAKQAFDYEQLWIKWQPNTVYGKDVKEVLAYVEQGNADLGIVYSSDAYNASRVRIVFEIPTIYHEPIIYRAAMINSSQEQEAVTQFMKYLKDEQWLDTYAAYGFVEVD